MPFLFLLFFSFQGHTEIRLDVNDVTSIYSLNYNPTPECFIGEGSSLNYDKHFVLDDSCNFFWFTWFVLNEECSSFSSSSATHIQISNQSIFTDFIISPSLCDKLIFKEHVSNLIISPDSSPKQRYVVQLYSGQNQPHLKSFSCLDEELNLHFIGSKYYLLTAKKTFDEASHFLSIAKSSCSIEGWIRPLDMVWE